ncbi:MAG TPA: cytochrome c oxidase subunit II [Acidobacteriaceae bacterium]|nr:cytochrome c oxidase subunit II [Acidobacteriaceae bacterium]
MMAMAAVPGFPGNQTSLNPAGPAAAHIEHTFALIFWITGTVYFLTLATLVYFVWRKRYTLHSIPDPQSTTVQSDRFATVAVTAATGLTVLLLFVMLVSSFITSHRLGKMNEQQALTIDVYGHQWWWEVQYPNEAEPYRMVTTANEIHVPVGTPIRIHGTSRDVIHSFWAPNIQGKRDLLPGYNTDVLMQLDKPGSWRGQCAEYCGLQHAHMSFYIIGESQKDFDNWMTAQAQSSVTPTAPQTMHGQEVFLTHACVLCHTIRGTSAGSRVGPDLTHLASRSTIAAGMLPNTVGNLGGWILNAQALKPGSRMPPNQISGPDLQDLLAYLETLK